MVQWGVATAAATYSPSLPWRDAVVTKGQLGANCTNSYECGPGLCCRDASGEILSEDVEGWLQLPAGENTIGTYSKQLGREGELCDCGCRQGLECYRPMTGRCCVPMKCYDAAYVRKQREYWENCHFPV